MSDHHDELPSLDIAALAQVTGGAAFDSSFLPIALMMRQRAAAAAVPAPAPTPAPVTPKIMVNGVEKPLTTGADGSANITTEA